MSIDEATRNAIHNAFREQMGPELAGALMGLLPPVGWADVATKQYVDTRLGITEANLRTEIAGLRTDMADRFRQLTIWMTTVYAASVGVIVAVAG